MDEKEILDNYHNSNYNLDMVDAEIPKRPLLEDGNISILEYKIANNKSITSDNRFKSDINFNLSHRHSGGGFISHHIFKIERKNKLRRWLSPLKIRKNLNNKFKIPDPLIINDEDEPIIHLGQKLKRKKKRKHKKNDFSNLLNREITDISQTDTKDDIFKEDGLPIQYDDFLFRVPFNESDLKPIEIEEVVEQEMFKTLCVPSAVHGYSTCIDFFKRFILSKFNNKEYFKTIYIEGKHLFDEFRSMNQLSAIKKVKPAMAIIPNIEVDFNREGVDLSLHDLYYYAKHFDRANTFFKDRERGFYIGIDMEVMLMTFAVKIKVNTRAKQLDLLKFLKLALKIGATSGVYLDYDIHVPTDMLVGLADSVGFKITDDGKQIKDPQKFLLYLNSKSEVPFIYKKRNINGKYEYFLRGYNLYTHISIPDINIDEGERQNQVSSNYFLEFTASVRMPVPKMYCLFSYKKMDTIKFIDDDGNIKSYVANFCNIPTLNSKGWEQFFSVSYIEDNVDKPLEVDISGIFDGDSIINSIINYSKSIMISPSSFIDFKIFNNSIDIPITVDWCNGKIIANTLVDYNMSEIVVYVDKEYVNRTFEMLQESHDRVSWNTVVHNKITGKDQ